MTEPETAWVAGVLEGEGSFMVWPVKREGDRIRCNVVRIQMGTTDKDVLERVAEVVGVGSVRAVAPQHNKLGTKPFWIWSIQSKSDARELARRLMPWLGQRRSEQAQAILDATEGLNVREVGVCVNGHRITEDNRVRTAPGHYTCRICVNARRRRAQRP